MITSVLRKLADIGNVAHTRLKIFGHHAGIADDHRRGRSARHQAGIARGRLTQLRDKLTGGDFQFVDQHEVFVAPANQLHHFRLHHRSADDRDSAIDVDQRRHAKLGIDVAGGTKAAGDRYDGIAVDGGRGRFGLLLPENHAASKSAGALSVPLASPSAEKKERRFQPKFRFMRGYH